MEPGAKTIAARFGFQDPELKTPRHDEIMIWLNENIQSILKELGHPPAHKGRIEWEKPVMDGSYIIGFVDLAVNGYLYFEVKPSIPSLGELIRQIQMYRAYSKTGEKYFVVSPDDRFRKMLESQDIGFVKCP